MTTASPTSTSALGQSALPSIFTVKTIESHHGTKHSPSTPCISEQEGQQGRHIHHFSSTLTTTAQPLVDPSTCIQTQSRSFTLFTHWAEYLTSLAYATSPFLYLLHRPEPKLTTFNTTTHFHQLTGATPAPHTSINTPQQLTRNLFCLSSSQTLAATCLNFYTTVCLTPPHIGFQRIDLTPLLLKNTLLFSSLSLTPLSDQTPQPQHIINSTPHTLLTQNRMISLSAVSSAISPFKHRPTPLAPPFCHFPANFSSTPPNRKMTSLSVKTHHHPQLMAHSCLINSWPKCCHGNQPTTAHPVSCPHIHFNPQTRDRHCPSASVPKADNKGKLKRNVQRTRQ